LNFGQTVPDKNPGGIGNILGNAFGNSLGTVWELNGNTMRTGEPFGDMIGTHWEQGEKKIPLPLPPQKKKTGPFMSAC
jgi:hypothetical protein